MGLLVSLTPRTASFLEEACHGGGLPSCVDRGFVRYAELTEVVDRWNADMEPERRVLLHELLEGGDVRLCGQEEEEVQADAEERERWRERMREIEYSKVLLGERSRAHEGRETVEGMRIAASILVAMFTGFVVCWFVGRNAFHSEAHGIAFGAVGMIAALAIETTLTIIKLQQVTKAADKPRRRKFNVKTDKKNL